ncbi:MAG: hypothetical protein WDO24_15680 [Pseudomonadota bacterium]
MGLWLETFNNQTDQGNALFKALGHPIAAKRVPGLLKRLKRGGPVAVFDPYGQLDSFDAYYGLSGIDITGRYVQRIEDLTNRRGSWPVLPVSALGQPAAGPCWSPRSTPSARCNPPAPSSPTTSRSRASMRCACPIADQQPAALSRSAQLRDQFLPVP